MRKKWAPLGIAAAGMAVIALMMVLRASPDREPAEERAQTVQAVTAETMTVVPRVTAYGEAAPDRTWSAVTRVSGRISWKSPKVKDGEFADAGDELFRIDDREYRLAVSRARADIDKIRARIRELQTNLTNAGGQLTLMQEAVAYNQRELERQQNLYESRAVSASVVEAQRIVVLDQQRTLASLQESHDVLPSQIEYQQAELAAAEASLAQAELDLEYTVVRAPFRGRIDAAAAELDQYVTAGQTLLELDSIEQAEITVGVSFASLAMLAGVRVEKIVEDVAENRPPPQDRDRFRVIVDNGNGGVVYKGSFGRISPSVDPATRLAGMVVVVDRPYRRPEPGEVPKPPLGKGTFCTVIMYGRPQPNRVVIPRRAIHEGNVYLLDENSRLVIRPVTAAYMLDRFAVIESGVAAGERLVVSDVVPAVAGMLLEAYPAEDFYGDARAAIGEGTDA